MHQSLQRLRSFLASGPIYPFELYTVLAFGVTVAFILARGLPQNAQTAAYTFLPMLGELPGALVLGVGLQLLYALARGGWRAPREAVLGVLRPLGSGGWWWLWIRLWLMAMLMTYAYFWLKVFVPLIHDRLWDAELARLDEILHLGLSPVVFAVELVRGTALAVWLDFWYGLWVKSVTVTMAFFCAFSGGLLRRRFMLSCCLIWTLGAGLYLAFPALGPVYAGPDLWGDLRESLPLAREGQQLLWDNYQKVLASRDGVLRNFNPTRGVAAMPSLHVGVHCLFALWAWRAARPLFVFFAVGTALTFLGSLVTGWHYAVDGYVGIALAYLSYRLALWWERPRPGEGGEAERSSEDQTGSEEESVCPKAADGPAS